METRYLTILDYPNGRTLIIKLTDEQIKKSYDNYNDFETFVAEEFSDKYEFDVQQCNWMITEELYIEKHIR